MVFITRISSSLHCYGGIVSFFKCLSCLAHVINLIVLLMKEASGLDEWFGPLSVMCLLKCVFVGNKY